MRARYKPRVGRDQSATLRSGTCVVGRSRFSADEVVEPWTTEPRRQGSPAPRGWQALLGAPPARDNRAGWLDVRAQHPRFTTAVFEDARGDCRLPRRSV